MLNPTPISLHLTEQLHLQSCILQGSNCSLVGPSNSGKSSLVRSLARFDCPSGAPARKKLIVLVDCQMTSSDESAFYELILRQVLSALPESGIPPTTLRFIETQHQEMLRSTSDVSFRAHFTSSIVTLVKESDYDLVLILDELDDALASLPPWPFRMLRGLHDELAGRLGLIVVTSRRLEHVCHGELVYEFRELFLTHTIHLKPMPAPESLACLEYLAQNGSRRPTSPEASFILEMAGGHPGFLHQLLHALTQRAPDEICDPQSCTRYLLASWPVQQECQRFWDGLEIEEQEWLLIVASQGAGALDALQRQILETRGLLTFNLSSQFVIFSPLLDAFIREYHKHLREAGIEGLFCNLETGQVWVRGVDITLQLSEMQREFLRFLYKRIGTVCYFQDIVEAVWGTNEGVTPKAVSEFVKRLRQKIEPEPGNPIYIKTVPKAGYMLQGPLDD